MPNGGGPRSPSSSVQGGTNMPYIFIHPFMVVRAPSSTSTFLPCCCRRPPPPPHSRRHAYLRLPGLSPFTPPSPSMMGAESPAYIFLLLLSAVVVFVRRRRRSKPPHPPSTRSAQEDPTHPRFPTTSRPRERECLINDRWSVVGGESFALFALASRSTSERIRLSAIKRRER